MGTKTVDTMLVLVYLYRFYLNLSIMAEMGTKMADTVIQYYLLPIIMIIEDIYIALNYANIMLKALITL